MAIAYDNKASGTATSASSLTYSHTVGSGSNRILFVYSGGRYSSGGEYPTGVTYNGVAMTEIAALRQDYSNIRSSVWYLVAPASGANNVVISYSTSRDSITGLSLSYDGASQTGIPDATGGGTGQEASDSIADSSITTVANNSGIASFIYGNQDWGAFSVRSPFTDRSTANAAANNQAYSADYLVKATAGSQEVDWNVVNFENWGMRNVSFAPAAATTSCMLALF